MRDKEDEKVKLTEMEEGEEERGKKDEKVGCCESYGVVSFERKRKKRV